jgi:hypothetical protein
MSSEFDMLKTKISANAFYDYSEDIYGNKTTSIAHNLSYIPVAFVTRKIATNKYSLIGQTGIGVDNTYLYIFSQPLGSVDEYYRYYIFYERIKT